MTARRVLLAALALAASAACGTVVTGPDPATDPESIFDSAWREFDRHFSLFAYKQIDWQAVYARYRPTVGPRTTSGALRVAVCALVSETRSYHSSLTTPQGTCGWSGPRYPHNYDRALVAAALRTALRFTPSRKLEYAALAPDIGYVHIPSFTGDFGDEIDDVLAALDGVRALVIDIRDNGGGNEGNGIAIAARFTPDRRVYKLTRFRNGPGHDDFGSEQQVTIAPGGRRHFGGPVAVLTNRSNGSAAEDFLMMMRVIPAAFTVGDTTIGNASNPLLRELPNGWELRVPQSIQTTVDHFNPEGRGFPPAIPVQIDSADAAHGIDTILERAVSELRRGSRGFAASAGPAALLRAP